MKVEFYKHNLELEDIKNVVEALRQPMLTTGKYVTEFENKFSEYIGLPYTIGLNSCTAALHLALLAYDVRQGDEVITTPMTFIATANAIRMVGAKPVFVDVEPDTGNIDADLIEDAVTSKTKAIIPVHYLGQMCDMIKIRQIANKYKLVIIEDSAHAVSAIRDGIRVGKLGDVACFSTYTTKELCSGEGGMLCTVDNKIANKVRMLRLHGMTNGAEDRYSKRYEHYDMEMLGWKYNMDNIHASLLVNQIDRIERLWKRREWICQRYEGAFGEMEKIGLLRVLPNSKSSRHLFTILVNKRDEFMGELQDKGIGVAVNYRPVHLMKYYKDYYGYKKGKYPVSEWIGERTISLPMYSKMDDKEVVYVIQSVIGIAKRLYLTT